MLLNLVALRKSRGLTQLGLAKIFNVNQNTISRWEKGERDPNPDMLKKLANFFNVSVDYLLGHESELSLLSNYAGKLTETKKIPIIGNVKCGVDGIAYEYMDGCVYVDGHTNTGNIVAFHCRGDSMKDIGIKDGDIAIVREQEDVESGELAIVVIDGDEGTLKRVNKFKGGISLEAANPDYPSRIFTGKELEDIHIVGKVLEIRRRF